LIKPKAGAIEVAEREAISRIQRTFARPMTVVVIQPKGGGGKTPTTICLSSAFGTYRGGYVVGWDDNETRGTLAVRVTNRDEQQTTVWDLLSDLSVFERFDARVGDLAHYVRPQAAHFDALVSDDNPGNMAQIGEDEYQRLHTVLQRFYRLIVVDTGNNVRSPNWQAAVNSADLVVVVSTYQRDVGYSASWVLDHLAQTGREELATNAITVLTAADPTIDRQVRTQLLEHFERRTRAVTEIPYDEALAHGGPIRWDDLSSESRAAWTQAGAIVVDALVEQDRRDLAARRG
jgi:MinD-like ATPase involved in chromosome partitioning or flagellar assembly